MLELELVPDKSLVSANWEFTLGMHFSQAVMVLQSQIGIITDVDVVYSKLNPLSKDLIINLKKDGIMLKFEAISQRLKIIEIYNLKLVKLKYNDIVFNSEDTCLTLDQVEASFGATYPGHYTIDKKHFVISFRGVCFYFPTVGDDKQEKKREDPHQKHVDGGDRRRKLMERAVLPRGLPPHSTVYPIIPIADRVCIYSGQSEESSELPPLPLSFCVGEVYLSKLTVLDDLSLRLALYTGGTSRPTEVKKEEFVCRLYLGDSPQEVVSKLGNPGNVFYKSEDKMKIHSTRRIVESVGRTDYFFNYFSLGIDVLFDGRLHKAKKFILHTNYPGHYNFNMYHRCEFLIHLPTGKTPDFVTSNQEIKVTAYTKWDKIFTDDLNESIKPVVLHRVRGVNNVNCFGPTLFYGLVNLIFEVMENYHIASVTVYKSES